MARGKLLLADDSVTIQKVVNLTFADEGIEVITAGDGLSAMELIAERRPDVILADVNMPGPNGYQICEKLRQSDETRNVPVLLLVGSFEPFDEAEASRVGASGFLTKPFQSIRSLVTQVSQLIDSATLRSAEGQEVYDEPSDGSVEAAPPTSDIDELYNQSLAEKDDAFAGTANIETELGDAGMDDEMIETTVVSDQVSSSPSKSPFDERVEDDASRIGIPEANDGPSLTHSQEDDFDAMYLGRGDLERDSTIPLRGESQNIQSEYRETFGGHAEQQAGPESEQTPSSRGESEIFAFGGEDLLELPQARSRDPFDQTVSVQSEVPHSSQIVSLSPELIDLIVEKVIERMSKRNP